MEKGCGKVGIWWGFAGGWGCGKVERGLGIGLRVGCLGESRFGWGLMGVTGVVVAGLGEG